MKLRQNEARWIEARQRWQINVRDRGERKTFVSSTPGAKGKLSAERQADKWLNGRVMKSVRFNKLWEDFLVYVSETTGTPNYNKHKSIGDNWLLPRLKNRLSGSITASDWQDCITAAYKAGRAKKTLQNIRASVTAVCRFAKLKRYELARPDADEIVIQRDAPVAEKKILQPDQLKTLFNSDSVVLRGKEVKSFYIHAWRFIVVTGLRRGEMAGIRKEDIAGNLLTLRRSVNSLQEVTPGKTKNARRQMVLPAVALRILDEQRAALKSRGIVSPWVFPGLDGDMMNTDHMYWDWKTYRQQHGINQTLHELRHTMISMAKADVPEQLLKRIVGHSKSMDTFGIYGHDVDGEMERTAGMLDDVFSRYLS
jgi:integrase